jgi:DNA (cytosine-5)-methyltransferase 1
MIFKDLIVDNFAGGGGASHGIYLATGRNVDIAINHDLDAIKMHEINHPDTIHYCESVWDIDPVKATNGEQVGLAWFSPDCTHFSIARGDKPVSKNIRGLAWVAVRWGMSVFPTCIMLENVREFKSWGPLVEKDGKSKPCQKRKGQTFEGFVKALTTGLKPNHPAWKECIKALDIEFDLTKKLKIYKGLGYIFESKELIASDYGTPTTRKRLFMVARRDGQPIVWPKPTHGNPKSADVKAGRLLPWRTAAECIDWSIPCKSIFGRPKMLAENTLKRIAKGFMRFVVNNPEPYIVPMAACVDSSLDATPFITEHANASSQRNMPITEPIRTICSQVKGGHFGLVAPIVARQFGKSIGHAVDEPMATVTAGGGGKSQLVYGNLVSHYGGYYSGAGTTPDSPLPTITARDHNSIVTSHLVKLRGSNIGQRTNEPCHTITAGGNHLGEIRASIMKYYGPNLGLQCDEPLHTITTKDRFAAIAGKVKPQPLSEDQRYNAWCCARFLEEYSGDFETPIIPGPRPSYFILDGYVLVDILMRMFQPRELFIASGFPSDYVIDIDRHGKKISKQKQVARCGNAVPPQFAEALVRANLPQFSSMQTNWKEAG